ncbi:hypothetical protein [Nesterenkonia lutea]|uniref:Galactose mutarotase-like enzyme n=1 Tax=Nesterenkonia lutea TaxID=272919 RepID=A0ABR9JGK1_9MICC|nr:hypothetical protein [Nesterenkonia lutea]MBE1525068.1 galactose mutarotase-like enzyme [Nesterenkonia lutea]
MDATNSVSITGGGYTAEISLLGGQLLGLRHHEDELVVPADHNTEGAFAGAVLAPWPNRTQGGTYSYAGRDYTLPVNEEATGAAIHGLMFDLPLHVQAHKDSEVQLQGTLEPSAGYPFGLDIALIYRVTSDVGLTATLMARYSPADEHALLAEESQASAAEAQEHEETATEADAGADADDETSAGEENDAEADADDEASAGDEGSAYGEGAADDDVDADHESSADHEGSADALAAAADDSDSEQAGTPAGPQTAPFGAGFHPYLTAGGASLRECRLRLPARTMLTTSADGGVTGRTAVTGDFDLSNGPLLSGRRIDHAFTDLPEEGWTAELIHGPSGLVVRMIADSPWVQVYTGEQIDRAGVAVEPMSCPPNALNSGEDLVHLVPGEWFRMGYSIEAIRID